MTYSFSKIFDLIKKTGDRCVVLTDQGEEAFVVMSVDEYEHLALEKSNVASLTEEELLNKINRDIAVWKSLQEEGGLESDRPVEPNEPFAQEREGVREGESNLFANISEDYAFSPVKDSSWSRYQPEDDYSEEEEPYYFEKV